MLCLLTSNGQYLNNSASQRGPGSRGVEDMVKAQPGEMPTYRQSTPQSLAQTLSIPSGALRSGPSHRQEQRVKQNMGTFEIFLSPSIANLVCTDLLCVIHIWTFRRSIQLVLFGMVLWFLCLLAGDGGDVSGIPSGLVELSENPLTPMVSLTLYMYNLAKSIRFTVKSCHLWITIWETFSATWVWAVLWTSLGLTFITVRWD